MAACSSSAPPQPEAVATPHFVNDLSKLSSRPVVGIDNPEAVSAALNPGGNGVAHAFEDNPGMTRHIGTDRMPAVAQLTNPKAAQFAQFSNDILEQLWGQLRLREEDDQIARLKLASTLQPVILTATLAPDGKLREIVVEQHSGKAIIDKLFIDACKKAVWARNPPRAAALPNGTYQVRIEGRIQNFATVTANHWTFKTYMGLALL
jgi:hypothetical protein